MKRGVLSTIAVGVCWLGLCAAPAQGYWITIEIEAVVDGVDDPDGYLEGQINPGDIITGSYTYESTTPDSSPLDPVQGNYWHYATPAGISLSVGGFNFQTDPGSIQFCVAVRNNNSSGHDIYWVHSDNNSSLSNGTPVDYIYWSLKDHAGVVFSSDLLPINPPELQLWDDNVLRLQGDRTFLIDAHVTSAVPDPVTFLLLAIGGLALVRKKN